VRLVRVAHDPRDTRKSGQLFRRALCVTTGDDEASGRIACMNLANGIARLRIGGGRYRAGVYDHDVGVHRCGGGDAAAFAELALEGGAIGLRGPAAELFDEEGRHLLSERKRARIQHRDHKVCTENTERKKPEPEKRLAGSAAHS